MRPKDTFYWLYSWWMIDIFTKSIIYIYIYICIVIYASLHGVVTSKLLFHFIDPVVRINPLECYDRVKSCSKEAKNGFCASNYHYMIDRCPWSCRFCRKAGGNKSIMLLNDKALDFLSNQHWTGHDTFYKIFFPCDADVNVVDRQGA